MASKRNRSKEEEGNLEDGQDWEHWDLQKYAASPGVTMDMVVEAALNMRRWALKDLKNLREANDRLYQSNDRLYQSNDRLYQVQQELMTALRGRSSSSQGITEKREIEE